MKANEFVKAHGLKVVRDIVNHYGNHTHVTDDARMFTTEEFYKRTRSNYVDDLNSMVKMVDLKRLIESHELVALFDDIDCAKAWVSDLDSDWPYQVKGSDTKFFKWQLEQAITDVESCMGEG